jgi:hypothetical protein
MDIPGDDPRNLPRATIVPHADLGSPDCPGLILCEVQSDKALLMCNDCGTVIHIVPTSEADETLTNSPSDEISLDQCPFCLEMNILQGLPQVFAYTCRHCGDLIEVERE